MLCKGKGLFPFPSSDRLMTDPVGGAPGEDVPDHGPAVPAARDPEAEARPVIAQLDHSYLGPLTLQLKIIHRY